jgi:hypothetical protein
MKIDDDKFAELLYNSPFDAIRRIKHIDKEIFFQNLYVESESIKNQCTQLTNILYSQIEENKIVNLDGFAGIGKTTFLHYYFDKQQDIDFIPIDFNRNPKAVNKAKNEERDIPFVVLKLAEQIKSNPEKSDIYLDKIKSFIINKDEYTNPILAVLKAYFQELVFDRKNIDFKKELLTFILTNKQNIAPYCNRPFLAMLEFYDCIEELEENFTFIINDCSFKDFFTLFFLFLFIKDNYRKTIIVFDNLDTINIDFLSDYFKTSFKTTLVNIADFAESFFPKINFNKNYKFIFVLRDGNGAIINSHLLGSFTGLKRTLNFRINYDANVYKQIIEKRIDYYYKHSENSGTHVELSSKKIIKFLHQIIKDKYLKEIVIPLFNADIRKISACLFSISKRNGFINFTERNILTSFDSVSERETYGLRGAILFEILRYLKTEDFLREYPFYRSQDSICESGHLSHLRLILIAVINLSKISNSCFINDSTFRPSNIPLITLFNNTSLLFKEKQVLNTLIDAFKFHSNNWVNLVTFRNMPFESNEDIEVFLNRNIEEENLNIFKEYINTCVNINPSGFTYIKYILTHFEYYSSILCNNSTPLFTTKLQLSQDGNYKFETILDSVYNTLKDHIIQISDCYNLKISNELSLSRKDFEKSVFSFKHLGLHKPSMSGLSHSVRLLTTIIRYIDTFRIYALELTSSKNEYDKINLILLNWLSKYNGLFVRMDNKGANDLFYEQFRKNINRVRIKNSSERMSSVKHSFVQYFRLARNN